MVMAYSSEAKAQANPSDLISVQAPVRLCRLSWFVAGLRDGLTG